MGRWLVSRTVHPGSSIIHVSGCAVWGRPRFAIFLPPTVRRHLAERKHGGASQKWGSWVASSVLKELTISLNPKLQLGYRNPRCRGAAETVTQGRSSRLEFRSLMPGSQPVRCSLVRRMGWVAWLCRVDWVFAVTATSRDEKPQPESGAGAFRGRDSDSTTHLRYVPSRLQLLRDRLGREADAG
jgi:hypothetical protein